MSAFLLMNRELGSRKPSLKNLRLQRSCPVYASALRWDPRQPPSCAWPRITRQSSFLFSLLGSWGSDGIVWLGPLLLHRPSGMGNYALLVAEPSTLRAVGRDLKKIPSSSPGGKQRFNLGHPGWHRKAEHTLSDHPVLFLQHPYKLAGQEREDTEIQLSGVASL